LDTLALLLEPAVECWVYVTLHRETMKGTAVVEVHIGGSRVGQLSARMSADLLPAIDHLAQGGLATAACARLRGNSLKADLAVYAVRAHELKQQWLADARTSAAAVSIAVPDNEESQARATAPGRGDARPRARHSAKESSSSASGCIWLVVAVVVIVLILVDLL
jgi:hypothetical protein